MRYVGEPNKPERMIFMALFGKKQPTFFDTEAERIKEEMSHLTIGSDEYKEVQAELDKLYSLQGKSKEVNARVSKEDKGRILLKVVSTVGLGGLIFGLSRFELKGNTFTGENRTSINTLIKGAGKIFLG